MRQQNERNLHPKASVLSFLKVRERSDVAYLLVEPRRENISCAIKYARISDGPASLQHRVPLSTAK